MDKTCPCGKIFFVKTYLLHRKKYCCKVCFYKYHGRKSGLKYKLVKENPTAFKKGQKPWNDGLAGKGICKATSGSIKKGERRSTLTEFKEGQRAWNKGIKFEAIAWDKHPQFKTGRTRYLAFVKNSGRKPICEGCRKFKGWGTKINVHHIDNNRDNNSIKNLQILCTKCHQNHHKNWEKRKFVY